MKPIILEKEYTRDTSLIIQMIWFAVHNQMIATYVPEIHRDGLYGVDHLSEGVIEVWENQELLSLLKCGMVEDSFLPSSRLLEIVQHYADMLPVFRRTWVLPYLGSLQELKTYINDVQQYMEANVIYSYMALASDCELYLHDLSKKIRAEDTFFSQTDTLIRNTLHHIYPSIAPFGASICIDEIGDVPDILTLKQRFHSFYQCSDGQTFLGLSEQFETTFPSLLFVLPEQADDNYVVGIIAHPGKITGKVVVVRRVNDISKIQQGDVVISPMTIPSLVSGLKRAGAIVTDEGGLLCHASVISRELHIPCIIATQHATHIFNDGDMVEVNAYNGIVRKI